METDIDKLITTLFDKTENDNNPKNSLSTYTIAKEVGLSWSTANIHCYKLKGEGKIDGKVEHAKVGANKKMMWWMI